ncbi:GntR family transcriptional regulator [Komagataeibacter sp. FNDCF1]|uniref:GntR family transcriptional regulator n=1 Tax=Komagataeibacter sp. FNDCF1 TaxID=2878681 RepID=UPI001E2C8350|nr:GntR family transcriptional regulator [Komagataeibacter sp. FNDCF1]MCE2564544.1 GntR family transcriptional regulator [Komagataeibacter sp. FNDCF1]
MKIGKEYLYEDLKRLILIMELDPDQDLDEVALSERYSLSRTPVRDVLRRLAGEGYLDIRENKGARVAPMNYTTLRNFFLVAPMIYAAIARLAVQNFRKEQLAELKECQELFRAASSEANVSGMVLENNRFHEIMGEMSGNEYLRPSLNRLLIDHARIGNTFYRPQNGDMMQRLKTAVEHHDGFIRAIESRDEQAVVDLVFDHWELSRENMEMYIAPQAMEPNAFVMAEQNCCGKNHEI